MATTSNFFSTFLIIIKLFSYYYKTFYLLLKNYFIKIVILVFLSAFHVFGSAGKMAIEVGIIGFLMGTCIAYFVVVGDLGPQIISKMFNINQSNLLRLVLGRYWN